jgi:hypothetical protein
MIAHGRAHRGFEAQIHYILLTFNSDFPAFNNNDRPPFYVAQTAVEVGSFINSSSKVLKISICWTASTTFLAQISRKLGILFKSKNTNLLSKQHSAFSHLAVQPGIFRAFINSIVELNELYLLILGNDCLANTGS